MSPLDRILRLVFAIAIIVLIFLTPSIGPIFGIVLVVIAGVFVVSSAFGFCLMYALLDFKTYR